MQNTGDVYAVNGWEAMPYDNHYGIVDIYRNCKGNPSTFTYYTQPLYVAVSPRTQFVHLPGKVPVDFYIVNEKNLSGKYRLSVFVCTPDGKEGKHIEKEVHITGGDCFGQLLLEHCQLEIEGVSGLYQVKAQLRNASGHLCAEGKDEVLGIYWDKKQ